MKNLRQLLHSGLQYSAGVVFVVVVVVLFVSLAEERKVQTLPNGWSILPEAGEVSALLLHHDNVWAGGRDGLTIIDQATHEIRKTPKPALGLRYIRALQRGIDGSVWIAHEAGITHYVKGEWKHISTEEMNLAGPVYALLAEEGDRIWVGGEGGLARRVGGSFERVALPSEAKNSAVSTLFKDGSGTLWIGSDSHINGGLWSLEGGTRWRHYVAGRELYHNSVNGILEDHAGRLWVATGFSGRGAVNVYHEGVWTIIEHHPGSRKVRSIYEDDAGRIWVGYEYDGLAIHAGDKWLDLSFSDGLAAEEVKSVRQDKAGTYWIGTSDGLSVISKGKWRLPL